ncbi:MAG: hypothetical protein GWN97_15890, partial [Thermoplasmata archaeon]|nr:hypothetical protein [Thermoplasmata archaeon]
MMGAAKKSNNIEPYRLAPAFEKAILYHLVFSRTFWSRIGTAIESDAFADEVSKLVAAAAFAVGQETGTAPGSGTVVIQRIARWMDHGRVNNEQVLDCDELLLELETMDAPGEDDIVSEFLPVVKERRNKQALYLGTKLLANRQDFQPVIDQLVTTERLGEIKRRSGIDVSPATPRLLGMAQNVERLPTWIGELDGLLGGGMQRSMLGTVVGDTGDGKSIFLTHVAGQAVSHGVNTLVATLELSDALWTRRLLANMTGIPIDSLADGSMLGECE